MHNYINQAVFNFRLVWNVNKNKWNNSYNLFFFFIGNNIFIDKKKKKKVQWVYDSKLTAQKWIQTNQMEKLTKLSN